MKHEKKKNGFAGFSQGFVSGYKDILQEKVALKAATFQMLEDFLNAIKDGWLQAGLPTPSSVIFFLWQHPDSVGSVA